MTKKHLAALMAILFAATIAGCGGGGGGSSSTNTAPAISSFTASKSAVLSTGSDTATLTVAATDADSDSISYGWTNSGGTLTRVSATQYTFSTTSPGAYTVTVTASDGRGGSTSSTLDINSFGSSATEGGAAGSLSIPRTTYRSADDGSATSEETLAGPIELPGAAATGRDLSRSVSMVDKAPIMACEGDNFKPAQLIVKLRAGNDLAAFAAANGFTVSRGGAAGPALLDIDTSGGVIDMAATTTACKAIAAKAEVEYADVNRYNRSMSTTPNDTYYSSQWHYSMINLPQAWDITTGSASVIVAVLDTGIVAAHADISSRLVSGYDFVSDTSISCDGSGIDNNPEDVADSRCVTGAIGTSDPRHSGYHGTHVAGTIGAATNNGAGVAGVTWSGKIMPIRVLGAGGGTDYDIIQGMYYAARLANDSGTLPAQKANIINMSLGGTPGDSCGAALNAAFDAVYNAGVTVFVAAGNEESPNAINPTALCNHAIAVAAVNRYGDRAFYSNQGAGLTIAAPGGDTSYVQGDGILSTIRNDSTGATTAYGYMMGTSMATPHAAGVGALMIAANSAITPAQIATLLVQTATDLGTAGTDTQFGAGLINAYSAVLEAKKLATTVTEPTTPVLSVSTTNVYFAQDEISKQIVLTNTGAGTLSITSITNSENSGGNWLSTSYTISGGKIYLTATVSRTGLSAGTYTGAISIISNGGNSTVSVTMQVSSPAVTAPTGCLDTNIYILAVDPSDYSAVAQADMALTATTYNMFEIPAGSYYIIGGTDCDINDIICDQDIDYCGIYPIDSDPQTITVSAQQFTTGVSFPVAKVTARPASAPSAAAGALAGRSFKLLR